MMRRALAATPILAAVVLVAVGPAGTRHRLAGADRPATERSEPAPAPRPFGIDKRVPLTTSTVVGFPDPPPPYRVVRSYPDLKPDYPIMVRVVPGSTEALVITQPHAYGPTTLSRLTLVAGAKELTKLFATPDGGTAYDIAFHPSSRTTATSTSAGTVCPRARRNARSITRYTMTTKPPFTIDTKSAKEIISWESDGHNGAAVCFGNDGMMYVTSGDGTSDSDTNLTGQRTDLLLAKVLRIDVDHPDEGRAYSVPKDNPFVGDRRFAPETWAYGLRNPWRISYDAESDQLWVGKNGQDLWEQAYLVKKGGQLRLERDGRRPPVLPQPQGRADAVREADRRAPSLGGRSLTGGVVYHGKKFPDFKGAYIYGDYSTGRIWAMKHDGKRPVWHKEIAATTLKITGFAFDSDAANSSSATTVPPAMAASSRSNRTRERPATTFPRKLQRQRPVRVGEGPHDEAGRDPVLA